MMMMMMAVKKELLWLMLVAVMATGTQQQQQQQQSPEFPPSPSSSPLLSPSPPPAPPPPPPSPADDPRRSSGESGEGGEKDLMMLTTVPSEDEGLILATGETAILECRIPVAASSVAAAAATGRNRNLSWTNTLTNRKMTTNNTAYQNTSLIHQTSVDSNETSLILMISNLTVAKSEFRCELDGDQNRSMQRTVKVTVFSSDWFCTFEGETICTSWTIGNAWTRELSSSAVSSQPASCDGGFSDHTYGKNNANGHFLIARVTAGDQHQMTEGATLNAASVRNGTKCIRFYYRTCVTNDSTKGAVQLMLTTKSGMSSPPINLSLASDWTEHSFILPPQNNQEQHEIMMSFTCTNASDFAYIAIDDIRMEDDDCDSANQQSVTKMESISESRSLLQAPTSIIITTNTALTTASSSSGQSSTSKTASTSKLSSTTTTTATQPTSSFSPTTTPTTTTAPTKASSSSLPPTVAMIQPTVTSPRLTSLLSAATSKRTPDESEDSIRPTDEDRSSAAAAGAAPGPGVDEGGSEAEEANSDGAAAAAASTGDNSTGLAIGIILAIMVAGACTAAILYRRRKNGKKSTYITFGNPSYSREHLPVNDFGLDSPLTLSSNGYTVLA